MSSVARGALMLVLLVCLQEGWEARGQSGRRVLEPTGAQEEDVLRIKTEEILLPVTVRDAAGAPVGGLGREKFLVFDNGVRQEIASFNRERVPANIVLLLDASGSVFSQMRFIREAAKRFMEGLLADDKVCVVQFADRVELLQDWTPATNLSALAKSLDWRYHPGLRTTFYDGLYLAAREQLSKVEGRRIIILLTDGLDTAGKQRASYADALNAVRRVDAGVYVVSLTAFLRSQLEKKAGTSKIRRMFSGYDPREVARFLAMIDESEKLLEGLAARTGGRVFYPLKDDDLAPAYQAIAEELRTQYIITYKPQPRAPAGEYRRVRVLVLPGDFEVATREGYTGRG
jgi:Ca-activated chloride channel homolog